MEISKQKNKNIFWDDYPKDVESFDRYVKDGIWCRIKPEHYRGDGLKSEYGGISLSKVERLAEIWVKNEIEILVNHPKTVIDSIKQFVKDDREDEQRAEESLEKAKSEQMPVPPEEYYWEIDMGGVIMLRNGYGYRLWNKKLGYMPLSE